MPTPEEQAAIDEAIAALHRRRRPLIVFWATVGLFGLALALPVSAWLGIVVGVFVRIFKLVAGV